MGALLALTSAVVLVLGDRPTPLAWAVIAVTAPALWLVAGRRTTFPGGTDTTVARGVPDGLTASLGVAVQYLALAQTAPSSGLWPVAAGRLAAVAVLLPTAVRHLRVPVRGAQAVLIGGGATLALMLYLLATQRQMLTVAVVLAALYPALPVLLLALG
jgi:hypothetical protein